MIKHTPVPWVTSDVSVGDQYRYVLSGHNGDGAQIVACVALRSLVGPSPIESEANARLIAAAPALLDALQQMRRWMPVYPAAADGIVGGREAHAAAMAAANAAIAAATGEQA